MSEGGRRSRATFGASDKGEAAVGWLKSIILAGMREPGEELAQGVALGVLIAGDTMANHHSCYSLGCIYTIGKAEP